MTDLQMAETEPAVARIEVPGLRSPEWRSRNDQGPVREDEHHDELEGLPGTGGGAWSLTYPASG